MVPMQQAQVDQRVGRPAATRTPICCSEQSSVRSTYRTPKPADLTRCDPETLRACQLFTLNESGIEPPRRGRAAKFEWERATVHSFVPATIRPVAHMRRITVLAT